MRLASIFISENSLPHIFGNNHKGLTLNLGGEYNYNIEIIEDTLKVTINFKNDKFINDFYGKRHLFSICNSGEKWDR